MLPLETLAQEAADIAAGRLPDGPGRQSGQKKAIPLVDETAANLGGGSESASARRAARPTSGAVDEVARVMQICNACRYCEGFCAVFPAMTNRLAFSQNDIHFLSNLCHNCGACLHACQYAPPHEFAVNVPRAMAEVRLETYTTYAWPAPLGELYRRNGVTTACALVIAFAVFLMLSMRRTGGVFTDQVASATRSTADASAAANFYAIFPHTQLVAAFGIVFLYAIVALSIGVRRFWRYEEPGNGSPAALAEAAHDALTLRYLGGGHGDGCNNADDRFSLARRRFHHFTFYGFMFCFASTCVATVYHYMFAWEAPYALFSVPVVLGTLGSVGLVIGPVGLLYLNITRHPLQGDPKQKTMDRAFILLLMLVSMTGLALLALRDTAAMGTLLAVHLAAVMALFLTLPYGKFAHGIFRSAALAKWAIEKRNPPKLNIGPD